MNMNTDGSRSLNAPANNYDNTTGLGILSPPSPEFPNLGLSVSQPQFASSVGRVSNLSPSPPDYYTSLSAFTQPISATATGPLPVPIFATHSQPTNVAPFIPPTPASASGSAFPLSRQHLASHNYQYGHTFTSICDLSSPSAYAGSLAAEVNPAHHGLLAHASIPHASIRHAVDQLAQPFGRITEQTNERELYAADLVEQMIDTLFRIWPDHRDPDDLSSPMATPEVIAQIHSSGSFDPRFRSIQQQATPESSPDMVMSKNRKRKRTIVTSTHGASTSTEECPRLTKRRSVGFSGSALGSAPRNAIQVSLPPVTNYSSLPLPHQATSTITLRIFCWELLRRSKTAIPTLEVAICYLDGVEDQVKELRECYMNGAVGFDCGPEMMKSRRRVYDEALRDRGRIIKMKDWIAQEKSLKDKVEALRRERSWRPLSPPDIDGVSRYSPLSFQSTPPFVPTASCSNAVDLAGISENNTETKETLKIKREILSSHPLLDPRRTLLASLVLATKFLQDRAYSNRAWAKLSGLPGHEVGRCERALGGALGWRLWVGKASGSSGTGVNHPQSPASEASSFTVSDSSSTMSSGGEPEADDGSSDPLFLKLVAEANAAASQRSSTPPRSSTMPQESSQVFAPSGPSTRSMSWPPLQAVSSLDFLRPRQNALLGDYSSIMQSAHTFDSSSAPTPLPIPPPPNATVINPSGTWYSSYVAPQYLVDQKTATSLEDARRILGEDGIDQFAIMAGHTSDSPMEHPVFASTSQPSGSASLGGADCSSPSTPPFVHAWNSTHAAGVAESSSADIDGLKAFSDYWINGDGLMPATYIPTSPLTMTAAGTVTQHDVDDISMASFHRQDSIMSTPGSTVYGISRTSTLVADPADPMDYSSGFAKEKSDEMMNVITNGFGSTSISAKLPNLWSMQPNEHSSVPQMI